MAEFTNTNNQPLESVVPTPAKKNYLPYIVLALLLIAVAGGVYWFNLNSTTPVPVAVEETPAVTNQPTVTPTPTPAPATIQDLQNEANGINISTDSADLTDLNKDIQGL